MEELSDQQWKELVCGRPITFPQPKAGDIVRTKRRAYFVAKDGSWRRIRKIEGLSEEDKEKVLTHIRDGIQSMKDQGLF